MLLYYWASLKFIFPLKLLLYYYFVCTGDAIFVDGWVWVCKAATRCIKMTVNYFDLKKRENSQDKNTNRLVNRCEYFKFLFRLFHCFSVIPEEVFIPDIPPHTHTFPLTRGQQNLRSHLSTHTISKITVVLLVWWKTTVWNQR